MKPHRLTLLNNLVVGYGLHKKMNIYRPRPATKVELEEFHDEDYISFLQRVTPENEKDFPELLEKFKMADDCPIFDGMYDFCSLYSGSSIDAARKLISNQSDIAINWSGGLHHAKKLEASGFCYVNDIVLAILELLRYNPRVLYIDIDVHHGDGVQEAFYSTDRVFTLSLHRYGDGFFPNTGDATEIGASQGKHYSMNVPLNPGIDDDSYTSLYKSVLDSVIESYKPTVIVLQCGADSLGLDRLGGFNLNIKGHGACVDYTKTFGIPMLILGGGGYTIRNVARCWTYETSLICDVELPGKLPDTPYINFFKPDYSLHPVLQYSQANLNTKQYLEKLKRQALEQLRYLGGAPGIQMQEIPPSVYLEDEDNAIMEKNEEEGMGADKRWHDSDIRT